MDDLIAFLRARLDEDREWAHDTECARQEDPARVLRDVEAKRAIVDLCEGADELDMSSPYDQGPWMAEQILRRLASAWSDHPDYDAERWAP